MSRRAGIRLRRLVDVVRHLLPAWLLFLLAAALEHPLSLVLLLAANALTMTGLGNAAGFDADESLPRRVARSGLAFFALSTVYTAFVAVLLAAPVWWLARDGSLAAALALSGALVAALFALWRVWPAFALPFVWDDAYPRADEPGSWLFAALRRSLAFAAHLTRERELFFGSGLPAGFGLLLLALGALALAGFGGAPAGELRLAALVPYALLLAPLAHALLLNRTMRALLADGVSAAAAPATSSPADSTAPAELPATTDRTQLDATLLCAAFSAQTSLALAALERGADPNALPGPDQRDQRSALMLAVALPDLRLLRALIAKGGDVNRVHGGITPLIAATRDSYQGRPEAVTTLLANGADPRRRDAAGNTALHHAAHCAEPGVAALLLDGGAEIDAVNGEGLTALAIACANANWRVAAFLLEHGARTEVAHAQPALLQAAGIADDDPAGVKLLLRHRAQVDVRGALERTALMTAALAGHARIVDALLAAGAAAELADHRGTTALMEAARSGCVAAIHALGKRKLDPDAADASGRTALILACQSRHANEDGVRALLALGADRTRTGHDGRSALEHAAAAGRWPLVALLDPEYPRPSTLDGGAVPPASADHLLDALRFGHWNLVDDFAARLADWPASTLAELYADLAAPEYAEARTWLLNHGLDGDAALSDGRALIDALEAGLPASCAALRELIARGAPVGGAGRVARTLARAPAGAAGAEVRELAALLIERGGDCCGPASGQRSALHLAVDAGDATLAVRLLERGADPNARDAHGRTPLHLVLQFDVASALVLLKPLIHAGARPEIATANGETPLGLALARAEPEFAYWLNWAPWRLPPRRLRAGDLAAAARVGDLDAVERLLALGLPLDGADAQGATALIRAAGGGHTALVVRLLELGADPAHAAHSGVHCLAAAVGAQREAVVRTLLNHGIAADTRMAGGGTALIVAAALGQPRLAEALLEAGADPNAADDHGTAPLHAAAQYAFDRGDAATARGLFEVLLRGGARLEARNHAGQDALLVLLGARAQPGTPCDAELLRQLVERLLAHGAFLDSQDQRGVSVLHACALHGLLGCARLLKAHGASLDLTDAFGRSAADVAALLGYVDVAAELGPRAGALPGVRQTLRRPARVPE